MLHLVTGRVGSGKSEKIFELLSDLSSLNKNSIFIVPEQYSFETEKNLIFKLGAVEANKISVFSFSYLAGFLLKNMGVSYKNEADDSIKAMIMSIALEEVADKLDLYSKTSYSSGFIKSLLSIVRECYQCGVSFENIDFNVNDSRDVALKNKIKELNIISQAYNAILEQSFLDNESSLDILHDNISKTDFFNNKSVFIDGFRGFTYQELKILEDIIKSAEDVYITVCADKLTGLYDKSSVFAHTRRTASELFKINSRVLKTDVDIIKTKYNNYYLNDEMKFIEQNFYSVSPKKYNKIPEYTEICSAENFYAECDYAALNIKKLISEDGYRCRDIAIICRDSSVYERQIKSSLKKFGVPVYIDKRQPVINQPLISIVFSALKIAESGFESEYILRILKTRLTDISDEDIAELENYTNMWQIRGLNWCRDFSGHPKGFGNIMTEEDAEKLEHINQIRKAAVNPVNKFINSMKDTDGENAVVSLYKLLKDYNIDSNIRKFAVELNNNKEFDLAEDLNRVWEILMTILDNMAFALGKRKIDAKKFNKLFTVMISGYSIGSLPKGIDEVTIGSADRVRITAPKVVFVVGVNDGVFPFIQKNKVIFSRNERERLKALGYKLGQSAQEDVMEERFISYNTFCGSQEKLFISYPRKDSKGAESAPSELIEQIKRIFPEIHVKDTVETDLTEFIRSKQSAFELLAGEYNNNTQLEAGLKSYFLNDDEYKGKVSALKRAAEKEQFSIENNDTAVELFGKNMYISATRAETYYSCPFMFFCRYGIKIEPNKTAELNPLQTGTIIHYVLENLIKNFGSQKLSDMDNEQLLKCVDDILEEYYNEKIGGQVELSERFIYSYKNISKKVYSAVKRLIDEFSVSEFIPVDFELKIDNDGTVKPLEIKLKNGTLKVKGSVDRVDMMKTEDKTFVRVIDYKSSTKEFKLKDVFCGLSMQMLIYLFTIWKNGTEKYENAVPAGVLYMPIGTSATKLDRHATDEDIISEQRKKLKMQGIVLDDSRVIEGMDLSKSGLIIPVKYKDNKFTGNIIDFSCLEKLYDKVENNLFNMGNNLHNGKIEAYPVDKKCDYCDYKSVCGIEDGAKIRDIPNIKFDDCISILKGGETNA